MLALLALAALGSACGQKGPLFLPSTSAPAAGAGPAAAAASAPGTAARATAPAAVSR